MEEPLQIERWIAQQDGVGWLHAALDQHVREADLAIGPGAEPIPLAATGQPRSFRLKNNADRCRGKPFCFALPPEKSATGKHHMPSLFVGCRDATVTVNGRGLPNKPAPRKIAGHTITTAMLAFSETWTRA